MTVPKTDEIGKPASVSGWWSGSGVRIDYPFGPLYSSGDHRAGGARAVSRVEQVVSVFQVTAVHFVTFVTFEL